MIEIQLEKVLVTCKILGLFVNPLTADDKYSLLNKDNLFQYLQISFSQFCVAFLKYKFNFEPFQKKDDPHS